METRAARKVAKEWLGQAPTQFGSSSDWLAWRLEQTSLTLTAVPAGTWACPEFTPALTPPRGMAWVGRPLRLLSDDALYQLRAYETVGMAVQFGIDVQRHPLDGFGPAAMTVRAFRDGEITRVRQTWLFAHRVSRWPHRFVEDRPLPDGAPANTDGALARALAARIGWAQR